MWIYSVTHTSLLEKIVDICIHEYKKNLTSYSVESEKTLTLFIRKFYAHASIDAIIESNGCYDIEFLAAFVMRAWEVMYIHHKDTSLIDVFEVPLKFAGNTSDNKMNAIHCRSIVVTIITNNRPFLLDSLHALLKSTNQKAELIVHPVFRVMRSNEGCLEQIHNSDFITSKNSPIESLVSMVITRDDTNPHQANIKQLLHERIEHVASVVNDFSLCMGALSCVSELYKKSSNLEYSTYSTTEKTKKSELTRIHNQSSLSEISLFLDWLKDGHFVFLGARYFAAQFSDQDKGNPLIFKSVAHEGLSDNGCGLFHHAFFQTAPDLFPIEKQRTRIVNREKEATSEKVTSGDNITNRVRPFISISKSPVRSTVHKNSRLDCIEVMDIDAHGTLCGIYQFVGIFTRQFFKTSPFQVPLLRHKVQCAFDLFGLDSVSYDGKVLISILSAIPHDELFHFDRNSLHMFCEKILYQKQRLAVHITPDPLGFFVTALIFLPREKYNPEFKEHVKAYLSRVFDGPVKTEHAFVTEQYFAHLQVVIGYDNEREVSFDLDQIESDLNVLCKTWEERLEKELVQQIAKNDSLDFINIKDARSVFPDIYQKLFSTDEGARDFKQALLALSDPRHYGVAVNLSGANTFTLQIFNKDEKASLSELMPYFQNLNLNVLSESDYRLSLSGNVLYMHNLECVAPLGFDQEAANRLLEAFLELRYHLLENDSLNALILQSTLTARHIMLLRAFVRAMRQMQFPFSMSYIANALLIYPKIIQQIFAYFDARFNPVLKSSKRKGLMDEGEQQLNVMFQTITRNDHDLIIRHLFSMVKACVRTNAYQNKEYVSFKFDAKQIPDLPKPVPLFEIFVYTPFMEGLHLRGGKVARGGIRWSERLEDFRQEILGLVKAQMVKNAIIVPLGAKGGFICRRYEDMLHAGVSSTVLREEIISCYQTFIRGLLDITDNQVKGVCVHPDNVVCHDDYDPYLVVAADKGTASFSDYANALSKEYNFWLDDAFASGGSQGYDHKKMAITSRGAWISVQKHFADLGMNDQVPFSVIGVGDMAGDIFGNGMLRSPFIKLIGAFNHSHIFLDPHPDCKKSYAERQRLFSMSTSSWADYNVDCISAGGGVFKRDMKLIPLSREVKQALLLPDDLVHVTPEQLIQYLLKARVDLLWFGGIGTYVRASYETNIDVRDGNNDALRIDATELKARVIGEGANLAMTQKARIEYALLGGCINTDAIDNSGGVSCSDHEVNIKILFSQLMQAGKITREERNQLLKEMTEDVAGLVLADNSQQNTVLSHLQRDAEGDLDAYKTLIAVLCNDPHQPLNLKLESLPTDKDIDQRVHDNLSLTRPELAVILAYSKIILFKQLLNTGTDQYTHYDDLLLTYFPKELQKRYGDAIKQHPLAHEIIATVLSNAILNHLGPVAVFELIQLNNNDVWGVVEAYHNMYQLCGEPLASLPHQENVQLMQQLVMAFIHSSHRESLADRAKMLNVWTPHMPVQALAETVELCNRIAQKTDAKKVNVKELVDIHKQLNDALCLNIFTTLSAKLKLATPWQRQTKALLLNDWTKLQVRLILFVYETEAGRAWFNGIVHNTSNEIEAVQVLGRIQNQTVAHDLGFMAYFIRYFESVVNKHYP